MKPVRRSEHRGHSKNALDFHATVAYHCREGQNDPDTERTMRRMTEQERTDYATRPDRIPHDSQCDRCEKRAVARGTDGHRAFALCADDYMAETAERRARPRVSAAARAMAISTAADAR